MECELQVGALPGQNIKGHVTLISLKAKKEDNTTVFPVEINIDEMNDTVLRAGYSANAHIIIAIVFFLSRNGLLHSGMFLLLLRYRLERKNQKKYILKPVSVMLSRLRYLKVWKKDRKCWRRRLRR